MFGFFLLKDQGPSGI